MPLILHPVSRSSRELRTALYPIGRPAQPRSRAAARADAGQVARASNEANCVSGATIAVTGGEPAVRAGSSIRSLRTKVMTQINFWTHGSVGKGTSRAAGASPFCTTACPARRFRGVNRNPPRDPTPGGPDGPPEDKPMTRAIEAYPLAAPRKMHPAISAWSGAGSGSVDRPDRGCEDCPDPLVGNDQSAIIPERRGTAQRAAPARRSASRSSLRSASTERMLGVPCFGCAGAGMTTAGGRDRCRGRQQLSALAQQAVLPGGRDSVGTAGFDRAEQLAACALAR